MSSKKTKITNHKNRIHIMKIMFERLQKKTIKNRNTTITRIISIKMLISLQQLMKFSSSISVIIAKSFFAFVINCSNIFVSNVERILTTLSSFRRRRLHQQLKSVLLKLFDQQSNQTLSMKMLITFFEIDITSSTK